jgi:dipeptidyl aminopeptidase/acylaminoacyl peptidase
MRHAIITLSIAIMSTTLAAQPHAFRYDDFLKTRAVKDAVPLPAGEAVVLQVSAFDGAQQRWVPHLEVLRAGEQPRRLTSWANPESQPAWSPDGARVAFLSTVDGQEAVWAVPAAGGEPEKLVDLPLGGDALRWLPDGRGLVLSVPVFADLGADFAATRKRLDDRAASGITAKVYDELLFRPWDHWRDGRVQHLFLFDLAGRGFTDLTPGNDDVPPQPFGGREDYDVSPDGKRLCYVRKGGPESGKAWRTRTDLYEVDLTSLETRHLTWPGNPKGQAPGTLDGEGTRANPRYSPDGRFVAYLAQERDGFESDRWRLMLLERTSGRIRELTRDFTLWAEEPTWSPDSAAVFFSSVERGRRVLYRVAVEGGGRPTLVLGDVTAHLRGTVTWPEAGTSLLVTVEGFASPPEAALVSLSPRAALVPLTDYNQDLMAGVARAQVEELFVKAPTPRDKARTVHAFLLTPAGLDRGARHPLVVLIHGGPQGAFLNDFHPRWNAQLFAGLGYPVLLVNPAGSVGYGQGYVEEVSRDWGGRPMQDILLALDAALTRSWLDGKRVCAAGGSYGGYMTNWLEGHSDRFRCLVSHAGPSNLLSKYGSTDELWFPEWEMGGTPWDKPDSYRKWNPLEPAAVKRFRTPMLVTHGANDMRVPLEQGLQMFTVLRRLGVESRLVVFPDETHFVTKPANARFWYETLEQWFQRHLGPAGGKPAPVATGKPL